ncbi:glycoside hydrolase family protein, partial [Serratia sp. NPDC078593]|uniref:glycoside hydrolase family protein n=1 Tax=Serratia sp. NPDC078593 TaxID=3390677 RepID=UPI003D06675F
LVTFKGLSADAKAKGTQTRLVEGQQYWILTDRDNLVPSSGAAVRPSWWAHLLPPYAEPMQFDKVICPTPYPLGAGDSIGHLGYFQVPKEGGYDARYQVHIECLSMDDNLETFLKNPEKVGESAPLYLKCPSGLPLFSKDLKTKIMVSSGRTSQGEALLKLSQVKTEKDAQEQEYWFLPYANGYVPKSNAAVETLSQYDLDRLGFTTTVDEAPSFDHLDGKTPPKGLVRRILDWLHNASSNDIRVTHRAVPHNYQRLLYRIDGSISPYSPREYLSAIHNPSYRDVKNKMIVKHPSEWYHKKDTSIWQSFLNTLTNDAPEWKAYSEAYIEKMVWMQDATKLKLGPMLWHMHPVMFLGAISQIKEKAIIFPFKVKPKNDIEGVWKRYYWAASLSDSNASQAIFGRNRSGGSRKHAARDLYSEPLTEIVAISNGVVKSISPYYMGTWQITVEHTTVDGRHFYIRYGEVDHASIVVSNGEQVQQGGVLAKTGLMINSATGQHPGIISGQTVYMLHFEYYPGNSDTPPPNNTSTLPFKRRSDLRDPIEILSEGYRNTFDEGYSQSDARMPISELNVSDKGKAFIKGWESFSSTAYNDSEGFCTIGYGHLIARAKCENIDLPDELKNGITVAEADDLFESRIPVFVSELKGSVSSDLYQYEFDALISLLFNMGSMRKAPLLTDKLNKKDYAGAADEFSDITNGGVSGLVKRRQKERSLFLQGVYDSSH